VHFERGAEYLKLMLHCFKQRRSLLLPANADGDQITAKYDAGVLQITIAKAKTSPARIVTIE